MVVGTGELSAISAVASSGIATATVSIPAVGSVTVHASGDNVESASIAVSATAATQQVMVTATPTAILSDGSNSSAIEARLEDLSGNLQSGDNSTVISFRIMENLLTGGSGSLSATDVTVSGGIATTTLTGSASGLVEVEAGAPGAESGMVFVTVIPPGPGGGGGPPLPPAVDPGDIATVAGGGTGDGNLATNAFFGRPTRIVLDAAGNIYVSDEFTHRVRRVDASTGIISTAAGTGVSGFSGDGGPATDAKFANAEGVFVDSGGNLFIVDRNNRRVRKVTPGGTVSTVAGNGNFDSAGDGGPATSASLNNPVAVTGNASGDLFIVERFGRRIRKVDSAGTITTVAGNGSQGSGGQGDGGAATDAALNSPTDVVVDGSGNLFIADFSDNRVRKVDASGTITTFAGTGSSGSSGDGGPATDAALSSLVALFLDGSGNLFITGGSKVRKVDASGIITTVAGGGSSSPTMGDGGPATDATLSFVEGITGTRPAICSSSTKTPDVSERSIQPESSHPSPVGRSSTVAQPRTRGLRGRRMSPRTPPAICSSPTSTTTGFGESTRPTARSPRSWVTVLPTSRAMEAAQAMPGSVHRAASLWMPWGISSSPIGTIAGFAR